MKGNTLLRCFAVLTLFGIPVHNILAAAGDTTTIAATPDPDYFLGGPIRRAGLSDDGSFVVFASAVDTLVAGDTNGRRDVFLHDTRTHTTTRLSAGLTDQPAQDPARKLALNPSISADGRYVSFILSTPQGAWQLIVHDRVNGTSETALTGTTSAEFDKTRYATRLSQDGRYVLMKAVSIVVLDRNTGITDLITSSTDIISGQEITYTNEPSMTRDGRYVAFESRLEEDRNILTFNGLRYGADVFVYDRLLQQRERVSLGFDDEQCARDCYGTAISDDGRYVAFGSDELEAEVAPGGNGRGGTFVRDRLLGTTERVSLSPDGIQINSSSGIATLSGDGRYVMFSSEASNLVPGDTNGVRDVFLFDRQARTTERLSVATGGQQANSTVGAIALSGDSRFSLMASEATTLGASGPTLFLHERALPAHETVWRSVDVRMQATSPQAVVTAFDGTSAALELYESTDDGGVAKDLLFGSFVQGAHPQDFNHLATYWSTNGSYPYAGKSSIGRGADAGEANATVPFGALDLQLHPAGNAHLTVAAFVVPASGSYSVSRLGVRRVDANGGGASLHLFNSQGVELVNVQAHNDRAWMRSNDSHDLGPLNAGDRIYFGVSADDNFYYDATEIDWEIKATYPAAPAQPIHTWDSYDRDDLLPITYYESATIGGVTPGASFDETFGPHPEEFNHLASFRSAGDLYPYAGRSSVLRGADEGETNAVAPFDVYDMQLHPPINLLSTVAAFHVTETGRYVVSNYAVRRVDAHGETVRLRIADSQGVVRASLQAGNDRAWVRSLQTVNLGVLNPGDSIYFTVDNDGGYGWDATEIAWKIQMFDSAQ